MKKVKNFKEAITLLEKGEVLEDEEGGIYFSNDNEALLNDNECNFIYIDNLIEFGTANSEVSNVSDIPLPLNVIVDEYSIMERKYTPVTQIMEVKAKKFYQYIGKDFLPNSFPLEHDTVLLLAKKITHTIDSNGIDIYVGIDDASNTPVFKKLNLIRIPFNRFSNLANWYSREKFLSTIKYGANKVNMPAILVKKLLDLGAYSIFNNEKIKQIAMEPVFSPRGVIALGDNIDTESEYFLEAEENLKKYDIKLILPK